MQHSCPSTYWITGLELKILSHQFPRNIRFQTIYCSLTQRLSLQPIIFSRWKLRRIRTTLKLRKPGKYHNSGIHPTSSMFEAPSPSSKFFKMSKIFNGFSLTTNFTWGKFFFIHSRGRISIVRQWRTKHHLTQVLSNLRVYIFGENLCRFYKNYRMWKLFKITKTSHSQITTFYNDSNCYSKIKKRNLNISQAFLHISMHLTHSLEQFY